MKLRPLSNLNIFHRMQKTLILYWLVFTATLIFFYSYSSKFFQYFYGQERKKYKLVKKSSANRLNMKILLTDYTKMSPILWSGRCTGLALQTCLNTSTVRCFGRRLAQSIMRPPWHREQPTIARALVAYGYKLYWFREGTHRVIFGVIV